MLLIHGLSCTFQQRVRSGLGMEVKGIDVSLAFAGCGIGRCTREELRRYCHSADRSVEVVSQPEAHLSMTCHHDTNLQVRWDLVAHAMLLLRRSNAEALLKHEGKRNAGEDDSFLANYTRSPSVASDWPITSWTKELQSHCGNLLPHFSESAHDHGAAQIIVDHDEASRIGSGRSRSRRCSM